MKLIYKAVVLMAVIIPLLATVLAIRLLWQHAVGWSDLLLLLGMYTFVKLGETVGFHRMLSHRSFKPHPVVKFVFLALGSMAFQGPAIKWAAIHTKHHAQADRELTHIALSKDYFTLMLVGSSVKAYSKLIHRNTVPIC